MAYNNLKELFVGICDALRTKKGSTEEINHQDIPAEILALPDAVDLSEIETDAANVLTGEYYMDANGEMQPGTMPNNGSISRTYTSNGSRSFSKGYYSGGTITVNVPSSTVEVNNPYGNASASDVRSGVTFMSGGVERTGTMGNASVSLSVNSSGKITATNSSEGYLASGSVATKQLTTQAAQTITPGTSNKTIGSGTYLTGTQTIKGDSNLVASNIKSGISIFGVSGTYTGEAPDYITAYAKTISSKQDSLLSYSITRQPKLVVLQLTSTVSEPNIVTSMMLIYNNSGSLIGTDITISGYAVVGGSVSREYHRNENIDGNPPLSGVGYNPTDQTFTFQLNTGYAYFYGSYNVYMI